MSISGLEKLDVWCKAQNFAVRVHKELLPLLPAEEKYALSQQIRRSSQSTSYHRYAIMQKNCTVGVNT